MVSLEQNQLIQKIQKFFISNYTAPANCQLEDEVKNLLEDSLLKQFIFANNQVTVIDHSINGYRYMSESSIDVMGYPASEFMQKGLAFAFGLMHPEDLAILVPVFEKVTSLVQQVSTEDRPYFRFNYSIRFKSPKGYLLLHQQNIPLAFNEAGLPYMIVALVSDITPFSKNDGVHYSVSLNRPGEPIQQLLSSQSNHNLNPLTRRENEIVQHLSNGLDTIQIAERLFISEGTVRTHRKNLLEKTGAHNSVHLVRMAVANGWV